MGAALVVVSMGEESPIVLLSLTDFLAAEAPATLLQTGTHWGRCHGGSHYNYWNGRRFWVAGVFGFGTYQWDYPYWYDYPTSNVTTDYGVIEDVQSALADRGYYRGVIDGILGAQSRQAIEAFQADQGLPVTGQIDGKLLAAEDHAVCLPRLTVTLLAMSY
jgi:hypothetical protein